MNAPRLTRFSFATLAILIFRACCGLRHSRANDLCLNSAARPNRSRKRLRKKFGPTTISCTASRRIRQPHNRIRIQAPLRRQNQSPGKTRSGITIRSQNSRRRYLLSIRRLPNCRPCSMARRRMSRSTMVAIASATGKSNWRSCKQSGRTPSTKLPTSKTKLAMTAWPPTLSP